MSAIEVAVDDPRRDDVRRLLERHWEFAADDAPPEHCHALDLDGLLAPTVTFVSARVDGELVGVGALKELDDAHGELKSMHTAAASRGQGVGRALVDHLLNVARQRGYRRVSLETGSNEPFAPALALYSGAGFTRCGPFAEYTANSYSVYMTRTLD